MTWPKITEFKNPHKFITTITDPEAFHKATDGYWEKYPYGQSNYGNPSRFNRGQYSSWDKVAAADPFWWQQLIQRHGPYAIHMTEDFNQPNILSNGLYPGDHPSNPGLSQGWFEPHHQTRPNHVYMVHPDQMHTVDWLDNPVPIGIDLRKLRPENINPNEDAFITEMSDLSPEEWESARQQGMPIISSLPEDYRNYGEWAQNTNLSLPKQVEHSYYSTGSLAHDGPISPEALFQWPPSQTKSSSKSDASFQFIWSYNPDTNGVLLRDSDGDHPADYPHHSDIEINHPDRVDGYALPINNGYRIFNSDMSESDPFITQKVKEALAGQDAPSLPQIRYHGDPGVHEDYHVNPDA